MSHDNQDAQLPAKSGRGGHRPGAGRPPGAKTRTPFARFLDNIEAVATRKFNKKTLMRMADADPWRFMERVAIPLAKPAMDVIRDQAAVEAEQLPLLFVEDQAQVHRIIEGELLARGVDLAAAVRDE